MILKRKKINRELYRKKKWRTGLLITDLYRLSPISNSSAVIFNLSILFISNLFTSFISSTIMLSQFTLFVLFISSIIIFGPFIFSIFIAFSIIMFYPSTFLYFFYVFYYYTYQGLKKIDLIWIAK